MIRILLRSFHVSDVRPKKCGVKLIRKVDESCSYVRKKRATFYRGRRVLLTFEPKTLVMRDENTEELP